MRVSSASIVLSVLFHGVTGFLPAKYSMRISLNQLQMAGGRSKLEEGKTKKQLFADIKQKLNQAATIPGFFEVGASAVMSLLLFKFDLIDNH